MRTATILLFTCVFISVAETGYTQNAKVTLNKNKVNLKEVLNEIENQTDYLFIYNDEVNTNKTVSVRTKNGAVSKVLTHVLKDSDIDFMMEGNHIILSYLEAKKKEEAKEKEVIEAVVQQGKTVTGRVTDVNGESLPGVTVLIKGTIKGTITDVDGNFTLLDVPESGILQFSFVGMHTHEVVVGNQTRIDTQMEEESIGLEEVVAIGYGTMKRNKISTSISSVSPEEVQKQTTNSIENALQGKVAGVVIKQLSGAPGGGSSIKIRGSGSIGAGDRPLLVIDGMPMLGFGAEQSPFTFLNMNDIESIDILKGVAAASIYGSRGSNGVILIKTKTAQKGKTDISISIKTGIDQNLSRNKLDMMNAEQFARWQKENAYERAAYYGYEITSENIDTYIPEVFRNPEALRGKGVDWYDLITRTAFRQDYDVSVSHGTDKFQGFFSVGYSNTEGTIVNTDFERFSLRSNISYEPSKYLTLGLSMNPTITKYNGQMGNSRGGGYGAAFMAVPIDGPYDDDDIWENYNPNYWDGEWDLDIHAGNSFHSVNPLHQLMVTKDKRDNYRLLAHPYLELKPFEGLNFRTQYVINLSNSIYDYFRPSTVSDIHNPPPLAASGRYDTSTGLTWSWENLLTYEKKIGGHDFQLLGGYTREHANGRSQSLQGQGYPDNEIPTLNVTTNQNGTTSESNWALISYMTRIVYDYHAKYLLSATYRRDGSSRFGSDTKWGNFPSLSLGWNVTKENFFPETTWLSNLKLRGSYGVSGNNNIGNYASVPTVSDDTHSFGGSLVNTKQVSSMGNSLLTWEKSEELDLGLDLHLFGGRLEFIVDYYNRVTKDMLWNLQIPTSSGFSSITSNIGEIENKGVEFAVDANLLSTKNFKWNATANIAFNKNKVISLGDVPMIRAGYCITEPGQPVGMFHRWETDGIINDWDEFNDPSTALRPGQAGPGIRKFVDQNGDGIIDNDDLVIVGNPHPKFTGGYSTSLSYKNWSLSLSGSYAYDYDILAQLEADVLNLDGVFNSLVEVEERWRSPEEPGNGRIPNTFYRTTDFRTQAETNLYKNISFFKLNNITLGYTFKNILNKPFRLYGTIQNPILITNYRYANPETSAEGDNALYGNVDNYDYPITRSFTIGLNINL